MTKSNVTSTQKGKGSNAKARPIRARSNHSESCGSKRRILKDKIRALSERVQNLEDSLEFLYIHFNISVPSEKDSLVPAPGALRESPPKPPLDDGSNSF